MGTITENHIIYLIFLGADGVLSLLQYLERKMLVRTPKDRSRSSSICNIDAAGRDFVELISDDPNLVDQVCFLYLGVQQKIIFKIRP